MIIVRIQGGLGNQLFQYAAAKNLALKSGTVCKLDTTSLHGKQPRKLDLVNFSFEPLIASETEIRKFVHFHKLYRHAPDFFSRLGRNIYREPHYHFDERFYQLKDPAYLDGYFQSEKYFTSIDSIIRNEFKVKTELVNHLKGRIEEWSYKETISVHIRRGDYTQHKIQDYHGVLPASFYNRAIEWIGQKVSSPYFCFFSDDINWVKENIKIEYPHEFTSSFTKSAIEDFYLMSQCRHNIIANSSFSWWAAWLSNHIDKIVVAPRNWFNKANLDTKDLIPEGWMRL